ncbi:CBS domain-containing protein [Desulfofarcimen acetoxidans DSM 771]|uniref:CBS domain-containing protein n=1 Tax=Desulfofarcimen acetoxidans (strain ATCC 49208 / DSM 771 / KCTC 5769 / VKM B-1644 / 5575) TaxID=485916 RepID=C8W3D4_DESAS|nr:CBS domain-containing protein [Desulfofarcimen acetoxidans]ACV61901.1 CBS domain-containing protein [Desulfofarcimen acetoxidans DSM 771]
MVRNKAVEEIMIPVEDYQKIAEDATVYDAIKVIQNSFHRDGMAWHGHRSVLVINNCSQFVGVLTIRGLLKAAGLQELLDDIGIKSESWGWYYMQRLKENSIRVRDVMRPINSASVNAGDSIYEAAKVLLKYNVNSLPVLRNNQLVGVVRVLDIFAVIKNYFVV